MDGEELVPLLLEPAPEPLVDEGEVVLLPLPLVEDPEP